MEKYYNEFINKRIRVFRDGLHLLPLSNIIIGKLECVSNSKFFIRRDNGSLEVVDEKVINSISVISDTVGKRKNSFEEETKPSGINYPIRVELDTNWHDDISKFGYYYDLVSINEADGITFFGIIDSIVGKTTTEIHYELEELKDIIVVPRTPYNLYKTLGGKRVYMDKIKVFKEKIQ
jgi:hypothetical protein